jgi:hypothetical protein
MANVGKSLVVGTDGLVVPGDADIAEDIKVALLACMQNVAWVNENGENCYNALYRALYGTLPPSPEYEHVISYNASSGTLLSSLDDIEVYIPAGQSSTGASETISDGALRILTADPTRWHEFYVNNDYMARRTSEATKSAATMKAKYATIPASGGGPSGINLCCMDSTGKKASILTYNKGNNTYELGIRDSSNNYVAKKTISLNTYYDLTVEMDSGTQTVKVNDEVIYTGEGHTYDGGNGFVSSRPTDSSSVDTYIESFVFKWT